MADQQVKLLIEHYDKPEFQKLDGYKKHGGYSVLPKALKMEPKAITDEVKASSNESQKPSFG